MALPVRARDHGTLETYDISEYRLLPAVEPHTLFNRHTALLLGRLHLIPEHHAHLTVLQGPCDVHLALLLQLLNRLRGLLPTLLKYADGESATVTGLALDRC